MFPPDVSQARIVDRALSLSAFYIRSHLASEFKDGIGQSNEKYLSYSQTLITCQCLTHYKIRLSKYSKSYFVFVNTCYSHAYPITLHINIIFRRLSSQAIRNPIFCSDFDFLISCLTGWQRYLMLALLARYSAAGALSQYCVSRL